MHKGGFAESVMHRFKCQVRCLEGYKIKQYTVQFSIVYAVCLPLKTTTSNCVFEKLEFGELYYLNDGC